MDSDSVLYLLVCGGFFFPIVIVFQWAPSYSLTCVTRPSIEIRAVNGLVRLLSSRRISPLALIILGPHCFGLSLLFVVTNAAIRASMISLAHVVAKSWSPVSRTRPFSPQSQIITGSAIFDSASPYSSKRVTIRNPADLSISANIVLPKVLSRRKTGGSSGCCFPFVVFNRFFDFNLC